MESEKKVEDQFFDEVMIDMGYVRLSNWEIANVDEENSTITFKRNS